MRKVLGTAALLTAFATSAMGADLSVRAPARFVAPSSIYNWTGFYVGIEGGGGWGWADQSDPLGFHSGGYNVSGGLIGGTLGYNWQINRLVLGLEADEAWANIRGSTNTFICGGAPPNCSSNLRSLGTFRGRVGWAGLLWWNNLMPYVTGGLAWGSLHGSEGTFGLGTFGSGTTTRAGWTVGGGIEAMLTPNWTAKLEYLYVDFRGDVFNDVVPRFGVVPQSIDFRANVVRAGLNYKFDWYRPFVTR